MSGFRPGPNAWDFPRSYSVAIGDYRLTICRWIRSGDYGVVGLLRQEFFSLPYQAGSVRISSAYFIIHFSPDILEFPGQCIGYRIGSIGRGSITTFIFTWHHVLFVWHVKLCAHGGLPWDMLMWGTVGIR